MMHFINGVATENISVNDRGLLYGQSLFETITIWQRQPLLLDQHLQRLAAGCVALSIPLASKQLLEEINAACQRHHADAAVLRITVTMGEGGRGYQNPISASPNRILSLHEYPKIPKRYWQDGVKLGTAKIRLSAQASLAGIKHGNRLEQVIARSQWHSSWQEALLLDQFEQVIEATQSNIFVLKDGVLKTPDLSQNGVAGVMREQILERAIKVGVRPEIVSLSIVDIDTADEVFLSNSLIGLWPVRDFHKRHYNDFKISHKLLKLLREDGVIPTF